jgi:hypothetical protein
MVEVLRWIESEAAACQRGDVAAGLWFDHGERTGLHSKRQPTLQQGGPHLPGAHEQDGSADIAQRFGSRARI